MIQGYGEIALPLLGLMVAGWAWGRLGRPGEAGGTTSKAAHAPANPVGYRPGTWLGSYRLEERLATGGMGEIWRARHGALGHAVAIKLIPRQLTADLSPERRRELQDDFEREARCTAALASPHTVRVFDTGQGSDGTPWYAMELLQGLNLEQLVAREGPQPAPRVIHLLRQVCRSLAEAHARGLVHRDIKSANLELVEVGGELDFVKVLDFGLACPPGCSSIHRQPDEVRGTLAYLPPEAARAGGVIDARSDLYAMGCVAYELLTGRLVFNTLDPMRMLRAHAFQVPPPPSARCRQPMPEALDALVMSLLQKSPGRRPASAVEVEGALAEMAKASPWTPAEAAAWTRRLSVGQPLHRLSPEPGAAPGVSARPTVSLRGPNTERKASA